MHTEVGVIAESLRLP